MNEAKIDLKRVYVYIVNEDLGMSKGKIAAQVSHVAMQLGAYWADYDHEEQEVTPVIGTALVLKAPESFLKTVIFNNNRKDGWMIGKVFYIEDAGLTQVPKGSLTCIGFVQHDGIKNLTKDLKLC
jgi:peptidyl-tRNA hydrolase